MSSELLQPASNAVRAETIIWMEKYREFKPGAAVTPIHLDELQESLFHRIKDQFPDRVGRKFIRTEIVAAILDEYGVDAFGVQNIVTKKEISDKAIKKYSRKK